MKRFKKRKSKKNQLLLTIFFIFFFVCYFLFFFSKYLSVGIVRISKLKVNEVTTNIVNDAVFNYKKNDLNLNNIIVTSVNSKNEIISVDVNMDNSYVLMESVVNEIRENIKNFQYGEYEYYNMESLSNVKNGLVIALPLGAVTGKNLIVNLGPKIPVKMSLLENVKGSIRTEVKDYGINNSLINVYLKIEIEQNIEMPSATESFYNNYEMLLSSKLIQGTVPSFFGSFKDKESEIVNIPVN